MMKKGKKFLSLILCAAALMCMPVLAAEGTDAPRKSTYAVLEPVQVWGKVTKLENGSWLVKNDNEEDALSEVVIHLPEGVPCVDAATANPFDITAVKDGDTVYAWVGPAMTMSLPPQASAHAVVANIPADSAAPSFYQITGAPSAGAEEESSLPAAGEKTLTVPADAEILPYLTKNIVTVQDLVPGSQVLAWAGKDGKISRVLLLPYKYRGYCAVNDKGEVFVNGEKADAPVKAEMLPLRAVAEALGYDVAWVKGQGAVVRDQDKTVFTVLPGGETVKRAETDGGDWELSSACVLENGVTYLPVSDAAMLLNCYLCQE